MLKKYLIDLALAGVLSAVCLMAGCSNDIAKCSDVDAEMTFSTAYFADTKPKKEYAYVHLEEISHYDFVVQQVLDDTTVVVCADTDAESNAMMYMARGGGDLLAASAIKQVSKLAERNKGALIYTRREYGNEEKLDYGVYVYKGREKFELEDGGSVVMKVFVEVSADEVDDLIADYKHQLKQIESDKESATVAANNEAIAAESANAIEVDVPIKSLCGFVLGSTPAQNWNMFKENEGKRYTHERSQVSHFEFDGTLARPFRLFTNAEIHFTFVEDVPEHLYRVNLYSDSVDFSRLKREDFAREFETVKTMLEQKFGIVFESRNGKFVWKHQGKSDNESFGAEMLHLYCYNNRMWLELWCNRIEEIDKATKESMKKSLNFSANEGADIL